MKAVSDNKNEFAKELAALARMVTYARHCAAELQTEMPVYCLDMALASILEEMEMHGIDVKAITDKDRYGIPAAFH